MRNLSYENEYDLHSNGLVSKTHFHMKGFALGLVLKQRQKRTRKWPIANCIKTGRNLQVSGKNCFFTGAILECTKFCDLILKLKREKIIKYQCPLSELEIR